MALKEIVPWKWGGLRRWAGDDQPVDSFRRQIDSLHQEMERLFEDMSGSGLRSPFFSQLWSRDKVFPSIDETEDNKAFHVSIELPGMEDKDISVTLTDRVLTIKGEKKLDEKDEKKDYYRRERSYGAFRRVLELPGDVDASRIEASFKNGVLKIELPKTKEAQAKVKHIEVKAA